MAEISTGGVGDASQTDGKVVAGQQIMQISVVGGMVSGLDVSHVISDAPFLSGDFFLFVKFQHADGASSIEAFRLGGAELTGQIQPSLSGVVESVDKSLGTAVVGGFEVDYTALLGARGHLQIGEEISVEGWNGPTGFIAAVR